jgi:hypothetical protein
MATILVGDRSVDVSKVLVKGIRSGYRNKRKNPGTRFVELDITIYDLDGNIVEVEEALNLAGLMELLASESLEIIEFESKDSQPATAPFTSEAYALEKARISLSRGIDINFDIVEATKIFDEICGSSIYITFAKDFDNIQSISEFVKPHDDFSDHLGEEMAKQLHYIYHLLSGLRMQELTHLKKQFISILTERYTSGEYFIPGWLKNPELIEQVSDLSSHSNDSDYGYHCRSAARKVINNLFSSQRSELGPAYTMSFEEDYQTFALREGESYLPWAGEFFSPGKGYQSRIYGHNHEEFLASLYVLWIYTYARIISLKGFDSFEEVSQLPLTYVKNLIYSSALGISWVELRDEELADVLTQILSTVLSNDSDSSDPETFKLMDATSFHKIGADTGKFPRPRGLITVRSVLYICCMTPKKLLEFDQVGPGTAASLTLIIKDWLKENDIDHKQFLLFS